MAQRCPDPDLPDDAREYSTIARLTGYQQRMFLRIVRLGQNLRIRLQFVATNPIRAV